MDIIFGYPLIGQFDKSDKPEILSNICLVFYIYTISFTGAHVRQFTQVIVQ